MDRWPRTFLLVLLALSTVVTCMWMLGAVYLLGTYGPCYVAGAGVAYLAIAAVRGDVKDQRKP
jgi:hypothetical protein